MAWFSWLYMSLFLFLSSSISSSISLSSLSPLPYFPLCHIDESNALLQFKNSFSIDYSYSYCGPDHVPPTTLSWENGIDCCEWSGVTCHNITGHVIGLDLTCTMLQGIIHSNSSLFNLRHLQTLILSGNDFRGSTIPPQFGKFEDLMHLEIRYANFSGDIPLEIAYLSKLQTLIVYDDSEQLRLTTSTFQRIVTNLTNLQNLYLSSVDMSHVDPTSLMNLSSSNLKSLVLRNCGLRGNSPNTIFHLPKLEILYLNGNENLAGSLPKYNWSTSLRELNLSSTKFLVDIPDLARNSKSLNKLFLSNCTFIGPYVVLFRNLTQLTSIDLSHNNIGGQIPWSSFNQKHLTYLRLAGNNFIGQLPRFYTYNSTQIRHPWHLEMLDLSDNLLNGTLPNWLYSLPSLQYLHLEKNEFTGHIQEFKTTSLISLRLNNNKLHGSIPVSIFFQQINLTWLKLSWNLLSGFVPTDLSLANFTILPSLRLLDLSHNQIRGSVPKWLWYVGSDSMYSLHLCNNFFTYIDQIPNKNLQILDLRCNNLRGHVPIPPPSIEIFLVSYNQLTGKVPLSICNLNSLQALGLAYNSLNGNLPPCIGNLINNGNLSILDMQMNKLDGTIPTTLFAKQCSLKNLNLNGNQMEGLLPHSLLNCNKLEILDIGNNNRINGTFPYWLESLPMLQVLILRSNKFYGSIANPLVGFPFRMLRILDLSHNELNGNLPAKYFESLMAMMETNTSKLEYMGRYIYENSVRVVMKGIFIELSKIQKTFTAIDFSKNNFEGEIPKLLGNLRSLKGLNLSHNKLTGSIPPSLGNLSGLEWLDLSSNQLVGGIPQQLKDIPSLAVLNLSENRLVGPIPRGKQFDTFENTSYSGNLGLCGLPLTETCSNIDEAQQEGDEYQQMNGFDLWKIIVMGYGCGMVVGISIGYMVLSDQRIVHFMERLGGDRWMHGLRF